MALHFTIIPGVDLQKLECMILIAKNIYMVATSGDILLLNKQIEEKIGNDEGSKKLQNKVMLVKSNETREFAYTCSTFNP